MSKWINADLFDDFKKQKIEEKESNSGNFIRSDLLWETPEKGTVEQPKVYEGRFLPDLNGKFYEKYFYHFWQSGENWIFVLCEKTFDFGNYCPFCSAVSKLYGGTKQDKEQAYFLKRKEKFVSNFYVTVDPRDSDRDDEKKVVGKVKLYEFPSKVEQKLKKEITDSRRGYGYKIFDPGEEGRTFILNVLSTKKDDKGKIWPDYSSSEFDREPSALGTEEEIDALMATCIDIIGYIESKRTSKEKQLEILKNEFLYEIVEKECRDKHYFDSVDETDESNDNSTDGSREESREEENQNNQDDQGNVGDLNDDDLLAELDRM